MPAACATVREQLSEYALGVLPERERDAVDLHVQWCAGCRKEVEEMSAGAATLGLALPPASVPPGLLDRVVAAMGRAARTPTFVRRTRAAALVGIAALVAISGLGFGAVMAGRAERFDLRARREERVNLTELQRFQRVIRGFTPLGTGSSGDTTYLAQLVPAHGGIGGGAALEFVSSHVLDFVVVHVSGLQRDGQLLPYTIWLINDHGSMLRAGRLTELDADGGGEAFHEFADTDLSGYTMVVVRDARGEVVLKGSAVRSNP